MTNKSDHRISSLLLLFFIILSGTSVFAQDAMTMLQFEDAEKAFNNGNYAEAIDKIDAVESKTGITSKTLYLRIITQEKQIEKEMNGQFSLIKELQANTNKYLEALKNQEIDDKFRQVYAIKEKIDGYPETNPIEDYLKAVGRNKDQFDIKTVSVEYEMTMTMPTGSSQYQTKVFMGINKYYNYKVDETQLSRISMQYKAGTLTRYKEGRGYIISEVLSYAALENGVQTPQKTAKKKSKKKEQQEVPKNERVPLGAKALASLQEATSDGRHLLWKTLDAFCGVPEQYLVSGSITGIAPGKFEETDVFLVTINDAITYSFDKNTHLLRYVEAGGSSFTLKDYQTVGDQKFPFTVITTTANNVQSISKIKSLRFNEALPEDLFEDMD